jgi:hypothetical protein
LGVIFICFKKRKTNLYLNCYKKYILIYEGAKIATNVLRLGDVAEIEAQMFSFAQKFNRKTELEFSTSAAILTNRC